MVHPSKSAVRKLRQSVRCGVISTVNMMLWLRLVPVLALSLAAACAEVARPELAPLVRARELLGPESWSAIVDLDRAGTVPAKDTALIFEFADCLWFYRPADGTQSLSHHWNDVAAERRRLLKLLQAIDPQYSAYRELPDTELASPKHGTASLPNGCFIESASEARRLSREPMMEQMCLLLYYVKTKDGLRGHTVLCYENAHGTHVYDPAEQKVQRVRSTSVYSQAMDLARRVAPATIARGLAKAAKIMLR